MEVDWELRWGKYGIFNRKWKCHNMKIHLYKQENQSSHTPITKSHSKTEQMAQVSVIQNCKELRAYHKSTNLYQMLDL